MVVTPTSLALARSVSSRRSSSPSRRDSMALSGLLPTTTSSCWEPSAPSSMPCRCQYSLAASRRRCLSSCVNAILLSIGLAWRPGASLAAVASLAVTGYQSPSPSSSSTTARYLPWSVCPMIREIWTGPPRIPEAQHCLLHLFERDPVSSDMFLCTLVPRQALDQDHQCIPMVGVAVSHCITFSRRLPYAPGLQPRRLPLT